MPPTQADILALLKLLRPQAHAGGKIRLGAACDGGYVVPDAALACDAVLSIGVGSDVSFDLALAERGLPVFQYDHTVAEPPQPHALFRFSRLGWGPAAEGDFVSLGDMAARLRDAGSVRPLLKFDIEGGEYANLAAIDPELLAMFPVVACELHGLSGLADPAFHASVRVAVARLTRHHAPVHLHANNYGIMALVGGVPVPDVVELSLLRHDLGVLQHPATDPIPGPLDRPNHPQHPDLCLTPFAA